MNKRAAMGLLCGGATLMTLAPGALYAAPIGFLPGALATEARITTAVGQAAYRRCTGRNGARVCPRTTHRPYAYRGEPSYGFAYGNPSPDSLPFGTSEWWRAMERWGRTGGVVR